MHAGDEEGRGKGEGRGEGRGARGCGGGERARRSGRSRKTQVMITIITRPSSAAGKRASQFPQPCTSVFLVN